MRQKQPLTPIIAQWRFRAVRNHSAWANVSSKRNRPYGCSGTA